MSAPFSRSDHRERWLALVILVALVGLSLAVRLPQLDRFVTPDEIKWVCRGTNFYRGLRTGRLEQTLQTGHPGVITMWLGTPFAGHDPLSGQWDVCSEPSVADLIATAPLGTSHELADLLFGARRGVALLTSLAIGLAFLLLWQLVDLETATMAGLLLVCDPFFTAHSRFLHLDAVTTSFIFCSVLALVLALERDKRWLLVLSGVLGACAALNKSPGFFLGPFVGLIMVGYCLWGHRPLGWLVRTVLVWGLGFLAAYWLLWPALWVQPVQTLTVVVQTALFYAENPHTNSNFFMGSPRPDPGLLFYPVALLFRLTPWSLLGAAVSLPRLLGKGKLGRLVRVAALFVLLFGAFMTMGQKKFDRYLLPVFPFVELLAAIGLVEGLRWLTRRIKAEKAQRWAVAVATVGVLVAGGLTLVQQAPYYITYYNPLMGGGPAAVKTLLVGWGEGLDMAARYLNGLPNPETTVISARSLPATAAFFDGIALDEGHYDPATTDYVVIYRNEVQRRLGPETLERYYDVATPVYTATLSGIDFAWVFENQTHQPVEAYLDAQADATRDAVVVSRASRFALLYSGPLPVLVLDAAQGREVMSSQLQALAGQYDRLWYVRYAERNPNPDLEWLDYQWATQTFVLDGQDLGDVQLSLRQTAGGPGFQRAPVDLDGADSRFGDALVLRTAQLDAASAQAGRAVGLSLTWEAARDLDRYYAEYVHLVDSAGRRWGQGDRWMVDETLAPTVTWRAGQRIADRMAIDLVPGIPPGEYRLLLGVYDRVAGDRLSITDSAGHARGETVEIGRVQVAPSPKKATSEELLIAHREPSELVPGLALLGWAVAPESPAFGRTLAVSLYWQARAALPADYAARLRLVGTDGTVWAEGVASIASPSYRTRAWPAGETLWQVVDLHVGGDAPAEQMALELSVEDDGGQPVGASVTLASLGVEGHYWAPPEIEHPQQATFDEAIHLLGFNLAPLRAKPGETVHLTLYWSALRPPQRNLTVFTHLLGPGGAVRGQRDSVPLDGRYPVMAWRSDETVVDRYELTLDADAPSGDYQVEIGLYDPADGARRVPALDAAGQRLQDERLVLDAVISVAP
jgi:4-amino-4-deoxy-L-arabinose transferase-like glycosyltransferase